MAGEMSQKNLHKMMKHWHEPQRRSWARRQNKVDELPIEQTAWTPDKKDIELPLKVRPSVSISLIPRDLEQGGRAMHQIAPESAAETRNHLRDRLPMMVCAAFAFASTATLLLLYLDSPIWALRNYATAGKGQNGSSTQHYLHFTTKGHSVAATDQETNLSTWTLSEDGGGANVSVIGERATAVTSETLNSVNVKK
ncbi:uncharacterized protein [Dermacentor albipictus]|uniref:uncharacterized protein n=1 Tax=Dermacentor albipictus TaxID=60249 RepID=UPI0031FC5C65